MAKFEFDITTGVDRFTEMAKNHGLGAVKVIDMGPAGWPVVVVEGDIDSVFAFAVVYYDPELTRQSLVELHLIGSLE